MIFFISLYLGCTIDIILSKVTKLSTKTQYLNKKLIHAEQAFSIIFTL